MYDGVLYRTGRAFACVRGEREACSTHDVFGSLGISARDNLNVIGRR